MTPSAGWFKVGRHSAMTQPSRKLLKLLPLFVCIGVETDPMGMALPIKRICDEGEWLETEPRVGEVFHDLGKRQRLALLNVAAVLKLKRVTIPSRNEGFGKCACSLGIKLK